MSRLITIVCTWMFAVAATSMARVNQEKTYYVFAFGVKNGKMTPAEERVEYVTNVISYSAKDRQKVRDWIDSELKNQGIKDCIYLQMEPDNLWGDDKVTVAKLRATHVSSNGQMKYKTISVFINNL